MQIAGDFVDRPRVFLDGLLGFIKLTARHGIRTAFGNDAVCNIHDLAFIARRTNRNSIVDALRAGTENDGVLRTCLHATTEHERILGTFFKLVASANYKAAVSTRSNGIHGAEGAGLVPRDSVVVADSRAIFPCDGTVLAKGDGVAMQVVVNTFGGHRILVVGFNLVGCCQIGTLIRVFDLAVDPVNKALTAKVIAKLLLQVIQGRLKVAVAAVDAVNLVLNAADGRLMFTERLVDESQVLTERVVGINEGEPPAREVTTGVAQL